MSSVSSSNHCSNFRESRSSASRYRKCSISRSNSARFDIEQIPSARSGAIGNEQVQPALVKRPCVGLVKLSLVDLSGAGKVFHRLASQSHPIAERHVHKSAELTAILGNLGPIFRVVLLQHAGRAEAQDISFPDLFLPLVGSFLFHEDPRHDFD